MTALVIGFVLVTISTVIFLDHFELVMWTGMTEEEIKEKKAEGITVIKIGKWVLEVL